MCSILLVIQGQTFDFDAHKKLRVNLIIVSTNLCLVWVIGAPVIQVMAKTSYKKTKDLEVIHEPVHLASLEHGEHGLAHVESVSPVVILDGSVVLLHTESPSTYNLNELRITEFVKETGWSNLVWDGEFIDEIKVEEHSNDNLESFAVLVEGVIELVAVEVDLPGIGYSFSCQPLSVVICGCRVVRQTIQCHSLVIQKHNH